MFSVENRVGRLVEYRMWGNVRKNQIDSFLDRFREVLNQRSGRKILCVDARSLHVMPQEVSTQLLSQMKHDNPLLERSAILVGSGATFDLQMERLVRESNNPARKTFRSWRELIDWIAPLLTLEERRRAGDFYEEGAKAPSE